MANRSTHQLFAFDVDQIWMGMPRPLGISQKPWTNHLKRKCDLEGYRIWNDVAREIEHGT